MNELTINVHVNFHKYSKNSSNENSIQQIVFTKTETVNTAIERIKTSHISFNILSEKELQILPRLKLFLPDQELGDGQKLTPPYTSGIWLENHEILSECVHENMTVSLMDSQRVLVFRIEGSLQRNSVDVDESLPVKSLVKDCLRNLKVEEIDDRVDSREYMFARSKKYQKDASLDVKLGFLESTAGTNRV